MENDTTGKLGESKIWFDHPNWWMSTDDGCCHTEIHFCPYCGVNLFIKKIVDKLTNDDLREYKGILENQKAYDPRSAEHLQIEVSNMKREHVLEMLEMIKNGKQKVHPEYLRMLINRNFI